MSNTFKDIAKSAEVRFFAMLALILAFLLGMSFVLEPRIGAGADADPETTKIFPEVSLQAKAAYVYDTRTETVLYAHNENQRLPLASLAKLMSALVAYEKIPAFGTIVVSADALRAEGDSGLLRDERWSLKELLDYSLVASSNDGMRAIALALGALEKSNATTDEIMRDFVGMMNEKASELDLKNTYFFNATGLDESDSKNGAYGSARDVAALFDYILTYYPEVLERTREKDFKTVSLNNIVHDVPNTNEIVDEIPGLLGSKTGFTDIAGGNLVIAFDPEIGRPIIIAVLGSTEKERFQDVGKLIGAAMSYIAQ